MRILLVNTALSAAVIMASILILAFDRLWSFRLPVQFIPFAWPLWIAGSFFILAALATFWGITHASGAPGDPPARLVTAGIFRYTRNPIYLGATFLLFGVACYRQSPSFLLATLGFTLGIDVYVRQVEELRLARRFGEEYVEYKQMVPRWLPRITRSWA
jgi:protein-S-isoprenylcysteine O-methyltransferase Ste14